MIRVSGRMTVDPANLWPSLRVVLEKIDYDADDIGAEWDIGYQVNGRSGSVVLNMTTPGATPNRTLLRTRLDPQDRKADGWHVTGLIAPVERDWFFDDIFEIAGFSETLSDFDTPLRRSYDIRVREVSWPIPWPGMAHLRVHLRFELTRAPFGQAGQGGVSIFPARTGPAATPGVRSPSYRRVQAKPPLHAGPGHRGSG